MPEAPGTPGAADRLHAPFRPARARRVAYPVAVVWLLTMGALAVFLPVDLSTLDRAGFLVVGVLVAWFLHRQASVVAVPTARGLHVRNLIVGHDLDWPQIVAVRFGGGQPWVVLDLADGETLSVMAIQRADGERGVAESRRLATLVDRHTGTARND